MDLPDLLYEKPALPAEETFDRFVKNLGGQKISDFLPGVPKFENADFFLAKIILSQNQKLYRPTLGPVIYFDISTFSLSKSIFRKVG